MLDINGFIEEVHANADAHGWWDDDRNTAEIMSLIHSEWSEALEEYRAGRPNVWHKCEAPIEVGSCCENCSRVCSKAVCEYALAKDYMNPKPEGVAIELIDGVIRIFDFAGEIGAQFEAVNTIAELLEYLDDETKKSICDYSVPEFVCVLHDTTSEAFRQSDLEHAISILMNAALMVMYWVLKNDLDPEKLLIEKHEYNKDRPYRHGNKLC